MEILGIILLQFEPITFLFAYVGGRSLTFSGFLDLRTPENPLDTFSNNIIFCKSQDYGFQRLKKMEKTGTENG